MLVKATNASKRLNIKIKELGRVAKEGETFEISNSRYKVLAGSNRFNAKFVTLVGGTSTSAPTTLMSGTDNPVSIPRPADTPKPKTTNSKPVSAKVPKTNKTPAAQVLVEPEIILIEPGKKPVKVDKKLQPIVKEEDAKLDTAEE